MMSKIISIHSFRGGTGKSNIIANIAALYAAGGQRVGVVDGDIQSPGIHVLFGLDESRLHNSLNDYLWGRCSLREAAYDVTSLAGAPLGGQLFLIPASIRPGEIARILREGYDVSLLNDGFQRVISDLKLDILLIDSHPGLNEETLLSIAVSDTLAVLLRPDQQDYQGTAVAVEVARKLDVPRMVLIVNKVPQAFDPIEVKARVEQAYHCSVIAVLPHSDDLMVLASAGIFALRFPDHPFTSALQQIAAELLR
jgi:septum site-determining protein MinD